MISLWTPRLLPVVGRTAMVTTLLAASLGAAAPAALAADLPDLTPTISASSSSIALGKTVDFTYAMRNIGKVAVGRARLEGSVSGAQSLRITQQPSGQPEPCTLSGTAVTCPGLVLGTGDTAILKVQATASSTTPGSISASATMDPKKKVDESNENNNSATSRVTVFRPADLTTTVVDGPDLVKQDAQVHFKVLVKNLGGSASHIGLDFRSTGGLEYESVDFVNDVKHGFSCDIHNPVFGTNYVSCSGGTLGDPSVSPANDDSVTLNIGARVKARGLTSKDKSVTATVDPGHTISESHESNNTDAFAYHYD
jgi:hypothetical protein